MKRLFVVVLVVAISTLVVVAPASAATVLHGKWTGGFATQKNGTRVDLVTSSPGVVFVFSANMTAVAGQVVSAVAPGAPPPPLDPGFWGPFPLRWQMGIFRWDPAVRDGSSYTATFHAGPNIPPFTGTLVVNTETGKVTLTVATTGSAWGWVTWVQYGELL